MRTTAIGRSVPATLLILACWATAAAQGPESRPHLENLGPAGVRTHLTDGWGALGFALSNPTADDLEARVLTFHPTLPGRQYGRDVWVPAKATLRTWSLLGPPPSPPAESMPELKSLLYDRTGGREQLIRSPQGPPQYSDRVTFYRREPGTVLMLDTDIADGSQSLPSAREQGRAEEVRDLVRLFRHEARLSLRISTVAQRFLPPFAEALDGIDHFVLGSDRIAGDAAGRRALREWLARGGTLWVLLDRVQPETAATLLGDGLDFHVVDRVSLTHIQVQNGPINAHRAAVPAIEVEDPVDFVRVLAPEQQVLYTVDGWPAAFLKEVGRGRVLFTTLGPRGWMRERTARDPKPRYTEFPRLPVSLVPFEFLAAELHPSPERPAFTENELRDSVLGQISYSVVGRSTLLGVFGLLFVALAVAAVVLGRKRGLEHLGWLGPALALGAAGVFLGLGQMSRTALPPTVATTQIVEAVPGLDEVQTSGFLALYQPSLSTLPIGAEQGGTFELDLAGLEGRVYRRIQTDLDRWHWENLELPAGVRAGSFRKLLRTAAPVEATVRFGPNGLEGRVASGPFEQLEDALLSTPGHHPLAIDLLPDGSFRAGSDAELHGGQLLVGGLLTDRQRARQSLYKKLLAEPQPRHVATRSLLLAWAKPVDLHFTLVADARTTGDALLSIPLQFERTPPGTRVTVPAAFVDCRRITSDGRQLAVATESPLATTMRLRFQLPPSVLPLVVESARLVIELDAPGREVVVGTVDDAEPLRRLTSPLSTQQVEIDPRRLRPDEQGVMVVTVAIGEAGSRIAWRLRSAGLELRGRTSDLLNDHRTDK